MPATAGLATNFYPTQIACASGPDEQRRTLSRSAGKQATASTAA
jgi:hypothetical protein